MSVNGEDKPNVPIFEEVKQAEPEQVEEISSSLESDGKVWGESIADLFQEGEGQPVEPSQNQLQTELKTCQFLGIQPNSLCLTPAFSTCSICQRRMCKEHVSYDDLGVCQECTQAQPDTLRSSFDVKPLLDEDGVTHAGRWFIPTGDTYSVSAYLNRLDDDELKGLLVEYQEKVKEAEKLMYSRLIVTQTISGVVDERARRARLRQRSARVTQSATGGMKVSVPPQATAKPKTVSVATIAGNMSKEDKLKVLAALQAMLKT